MIFYAADDARMAWWAPLPPRKDPQGMRLERFDRSAHTHLQGQIGPLANARSSSGCAIVFATDSPVVQVHLARVRHHQPGPQGVDLSWQDDDGQWQHSYSGDIRECEGDCVLTLPTALQGQQRPVWIWLPCISTALVAGISLPPSATLAATSLPEPRWLAIGDSLTQGFCVEQPTRNWVHRLSERWNMPVWNMGIGGLQIEPEIFAPVLQQKSWELVTVGLGSNHAWRQSTMATITERTLSLVDLLLQGGHQRIVWLLPPWKPCEQGLGPSDFQGVPLDARAGERCTQVRDELERLLAPFPPRIELIGGLLPQDPRLLPDGLHPLANGMALQAEAVTTQLGLP